MGDKMDDIKIEEREEKTRAFKVFRELMPYAIIIIVVILIRTFIATPVRVNGVSMKPYLKEGDVLILNKLDKSYKRFDIVVINVDNTKIIKRVIGLPGETVRYEDCKLYIDDEIVEDYVKKCITEDFSLESLYNYVMIPKGYYFVMGDNRTESSDSRDYRVGLIKESQIEGTAVIRLYPFNKIGKI
jgi:signal peptidase I, bacterial type